MPAREPEKEMAKPVIVIPVTEMIRIQTPFFVRKQKKKGNPADKQAAKPAGLSKLPATLNLPTVGNSRKNCAIPYMACTVQSMVIMIQTGKTKSFSRNAFISENTPYRVKVINMAVDKNINEYHLGAVCALTKEELLRNKVPKQSKKKNRNTTYEYSFTP